MYAGVSLGQELPSPPEQSGSFIVYVRRLTVKPKLVKGRGGYHELFREQRGLVWDGRGFLRGVGQGREQKRAWAGCGRDQSSLCAVTAQWREKPLLGASLRVNSYASLC